MLIANPIYDSVFKYLMEDPEVARILIGNIIGRKILQLDARPQEQSLRTQDYALTIFRLDYKALVETESGERLKILIELQKSSHLSDIERFRRYLGENYKATDTVDGEAVSLPIISIYFLGDRMSVPNALIRVSPDTRDLLSGAAIQTNDRFIRLLTHESYFIQIQRLPQNEQHKLAQLLSVFDQSRLAHNRERWFLNFTDVNEIADPDLRAIAKRLREGLYNEEMLELVKSEEEIEHQLDKLTRAKLEAEDRAKAAEKQILQERARFAKVLADMGKTIAEIAASLGTTEDEIRNWLA